MTNTLKPILFFGTEDFSARFLTALLRSGYPIHAVVTKPDSKKGRGQKVTAPLVKKIAQLHNIPVWQPTKLTEIKQAVEQLDQPAGILVSYGNIIPQSILQLFTPGIINVHPSLLPKYRGPSPIEAAILSGDTATGVTIMKLEKAMDVGPVYGQRRLQLTSNETKSDLYLSLGDIGEDLLLELLPSILGGELQATLQNDHQATYCSILTKSDGVLDPTKLSAIEAERRVRAYLGFPKTKLTVFDQPVIITKAHVAQQQKTPLDVEFNDGAFLSIDELVAPSGKTITGEAFLKGYAK